MNTYNIQDNEVKLFTPKEIKEHLDKCIIGQDHAKKVLSVAVYNHYKRFFLNIKGERIDKSNIVIAGPTGCGKTAIVKEIANMLNVPCYIADSTSLTQAGYVGDDVESIITGLLRMCNFNVGQAQYGIICLDEVDKLSKRGSNQHITRDVVGEGVQQALLKIVEGGIVGVSPQGGRKHPEQELIYVDTTNILFISMGAFVGLDEIIRKRVGGVSRIGFGGDAADKVSDDDIYKYMSSEDLVQFGLIPEFVGRFPVRTYVEHLDVKSLKRILIEPENSIIHQYEVMFALDGKELKFTDGALEEIADCAQHMNTGARALRSIVEHVMLDIMFDAPSSDEKIIKIDKKLVQSKLKDYKR